MLILTLTNFVNAQSRSASPATEVVRLQKALDAALNKVTDLQDVIVKGDKALADKDVALKDAYTVIGGLNKEVEIAQSALDKSGTSVQALATTVNKQTDTIVKQSDTIVEQAKAKAKAEVDLENAKKSADRWKIAAGVAGVAAILTRIL
jgi:uncharacterized coiled-coil protein SlyX